MELVSSAEKSIILLDNYVDVDTLNILAKKKRDVNVRLYTMQQTKLTSVNVKNFNRQYPKLEVKFTGVFHDRFLIIDNIQIYLIGASLKDAGKSALLFGLMEDRGIVKGFSQRLCPKNQIYNKF